jgi:hypothetical protein
LFLFRIAIYFPNPHFVNFARKHFNSSKKTDKMLKENLAGRFSGFFTEK